MIGVICPPTLEALVAVCNWEGALLHCQLVKFGELLKCGRKRHKNGSDDGGKKIYSWNFVNISLVKLVMRGKNEMGYEKSRGYFG